MQDPDARLRWMGPIVYSSDLCVPQTETHCLELPGRGVVMSQAKSPSVSFLAGCSHHTRLNHSVQVADQRREWNTKETGKKNTSGGLVIWAGMKGVTFSVWQYRNTLFKSEQMPPDGTSGASFLVSWLKWRALCRCPGWCRFTPAS